MEDASHTNPNTGTPFGETATYSRGATTPAAVADGGEANAKDADGERSAETVADVDHTPREGAPDASEVYERGGEGE